MIDIDMNDSGNNQAEYREKFVLIEHSKRAGWVIICVKCVTRWSYLPAEWGTNLENFSLTAM